MWFIGVEVEQETSATPPKKNPGSAPAMPSLNPKEKRDCSQSVQSTFDCTLPFHARAIKVKFLKNYQACHCYLRLELLVADGY